jgi:hypothetical protein
MNFLLKLLKKIGILEIMLRSVSLAALSLLCATAATASPIIDSITTTHDSSNLYISTHFTPGTLDQSNYQLTLYIDIDQNTSTGSLGAPGAEYEIYLSQYGFGFHSIFQGPNSNFTISPTSLMSADPNFWLFSSVLASLNVTANAINLTAPLSLFANDDGNVDISAYVSNVAYPPSSFDGPFFVIDFSANGGPFYLSVPEPGSVALFLLGMAFLLAVRSRSRRIQI